MASVSATSTTKRHWVGIPELLGGTKVISGTPVAATTAPLSIADIAASLVQLTDAAGNVYEIGQAIVFTIEAADVDPGIQTVNFTWASNDSQDGSLTFTVRVIEQTSVPLNRDPP